MTDSFMKLPETFKMCDVPEKLFVDKEYLYESNAGTLRKAIKRGSFPSIYIKLLFALNDYEKLYTVCEEALLTTSTEVLLQMLESLRREVEDDDTILDVMDSLVGWCKSDLVLPKRKKAIHNTYEEAMEFAEDVCACTGQVSPSIRRELEYDIYLVNLKHKRYQKKRKHIKDTKRHFREVKRHQCWVEYTERSYHAHVTYKHLRAQKVFLEEEYYDTDPSNWYDEWFHDPYELDYCNYVMEMCNHEWEDYVDESGRVLEEYEHPKEHNCKGVCHTGTCISCDWQIQHDAATGWDDTNFIEWWDYTRDYWGRFVKKG